jgi:hypothetical protein
MAVARWVAVAALAAAPTCFAEITQLSRELDIELSQSSRFRPIDSISRLPAPVVALFVDHKGRVADRGAPWEPGDVITDETLPTKRLKWAVEGPRIYIVHYERGGRTQSYYTLVASLDADGAAAKAEWRALGRALSGYPDLITAIRKDELEDNPRYFTFYEWLEQRRGSFPR